MIPRELEKIEVINSCLLRHLMNLRPGLNLRRGSNSLNSDSVRRTLVLSGIAVICVLKVAYV